MQTRRGGAAGFGESRAGFLTAGIHIRRAQAATITEGDLILIGAIAFKSIDEPVGDALGLTLSPTHVSIEYLSQINYH